MVAEWPFVCGSLQTLIIFLLFEARNHVSILNFNRICNNNTCLLALDITVCENTIQK